MTCPGSGPPSRPGLDGLTMSSLTGKLVLSLVRGSDYAHAGEEEAIELALGPVVGIAPLRFLDVGCGIGGTARYVAERCWGTVTTSSPISGQRSRQPDRIEPMLRTAGWRLDEVAPAHDEYQRWYDALAARIESMCAAIIGQSSPDFYDFVLARYAEMRGDVRAGRLGGATVYATAG